MAAIIRASLTAGRQALDRRSGRMLRSSPDQRSASPGETGEARVITEERVEALERRAERLEQRMLRLEAHVLDGAPRRAATANAAAARGAATAPTPAPAAPSRPPLVRPDRPARELDFEQLVGGRLLAWVGGAAVLAGLALLFALAASRGWI